MKNYGKLLLISTTVIFSAALFSCSSGNIDFNSESDTTKENASPQSITFDWQNAYETKLNEFKNSDEYSPDMKTGSRFDLFDITGDNIPELIISPNNQGQTTCRIFSCSNGELIELGEAGNCGTFSYLPDLKLIKDEYLGSGFVIGKYISYSNGEFTTIISYNDNSMSASEGASIYYKIDGMDVLLPEYDAALAPYKDAVYVETGRKYTFGENSLNYAIRYSESWGAVMNQNQKEAYKSVLTEQLNSANSNTCTFEIFDLNNDDNPELIISNGNDEENYCEIYCYENGEVKHIDGSFGAFGEFTFDIEKFVVSAGAMRWFINNSTDSADTYEFSESLAEVGRKYLLTDSNINFALN